MAADKARGIAFHLADHLWYRFESRDRYVPIGVDDRLTPGKALSFELLDGAGGLAESTGDFIYQETKERRRLESGLWGIFRVGDHRNDFHEPIQPLPDRCQLPLTERPGWRVATGDFTGDGTRDILIGVPQSCLGGAAAGAAYLFTGSVDPSTITDLSAADVRLVETQAGTHAGETVALTDHTGDGTMNIVVESDAMRYVFTRSQLVHGQSSMAHDVQLVDAAITEKL